MTSMNDYQDSFEASTTATHEDEETTSVRTGSTTTTPSVHVSAGNEDSGADVGGTVSEDEMGCDGPTSSSAVTPSLTAKNSQLPLAGAPAAVPVPVPVPVPAPSVSTSLATQLRDDRKHGLRVSGSPMRDAQSSEQSFGAVSISKSAKMEGEVSSAILPGSDRLQSFVTRSASDTAHDVFKENANNVANPRFRGPKGAGYEALSHFVAFHSSGSESTRGSMLKPQVFGSGNQMSASQSSMESLRASKMSAQNAEPGGSAEKEPTTACLVTPSASAQQAKSPQKTASESKEASVVLSSVFSTLSQHLQQQPPPQKPQPTVASAPVVGPGVANPSHPAPASAAPATWSTSDQGPTVTPAPLQAPRLLDFSPLPALTMQTQSPQAPTVFSLPALPPPGLSYTSDTKSATATTEVPSPIVATAEAKDSTASQSRWMIGDVQCRSTPIEKTASQQISLPPPPLVPNGPTLEQKHTSDLREASEAVERLVKAFAVLKGYSRLETCQSRSRPLADSVPVSEGTTSIVSAAAHRVGGPSAVQVHQDVRSRGPRVFVPGEASSKASLLRAPVSQQKDRERLAEGLVLDCVLGLLGEHARSTTTSSAGGQVREGVEKLKRPTTTSSQAVARPHSEVVTADAFAYRGGTMLHGGTPNCAAGTALADAPTHAYFNPSSASVLGLCSSGTTLFDPRDRQSAVDLYNVVREALEKYVLRRVVTGREKAEDLPPRARPIPVIFAWALLLDAMNLCEEIARVAYGAAPCTPSAVYPVLAQFRGDTACEEVAKAAMHCLPFEALSTNSRDTSVPRDGVCVFRMACWVTQQQLWTIADALVDTVREDMVRRSKALQYSLFNAAAVPEVDPRVLVPPSTPMFTLRPLPGRKGDSTVPMTADASSAAATAASYRRIYEGDGGERKRSVRGNSDQDLFEVPTAALQKVAYHVSLLSTDLLSDMGTAKHRAPTTLTAEEYPNAATAVAETLSELLQDESIKAAVQRRAAEKVKKAQMERTNSASATRQRKEQAIIEKAEREAEEVVQRILQEMRAQGVA